MNKISDIEDLPKFFARKVMSASGEPMGDIQATIFRVPAYIRKTSAFEPKIVSLGPYHRRLDEFGERIKLSYANNFFRRIIDKDTKLEQHVIERLITDFVQHIFEGFRNSEFDLRAAYSQKIYMDDIDFLGMMMLDCVFMAEFLLLQREIKIGHGIEIEECYPWRRRATPLIFQDMLILENQVPLSLLYQVLTEHMKFSKHELDYQTSSEFFFEDFILQIHRNLSPTSNVITSYSLLSNETSAHLLHSLYLSLVSELQKKASHLLHTVEFPSFSSAQMLQAMRIQFTNKTDGSSFLDITFDERKRSMGIPQLLIDDDNISLLRNLMAFEQQCHGHGVGYYISTYIWFMDCLINTDKDVAVLRKHKIIVSRLHTDEEVAHIFKELRKTDATVVDFDRFYLAEVMINVDSYCRTSSNAKRIWALRNFSWWRQNYFKNRWVTIRRHCTCFLQSFHFGANR